MPQQTGWPTKAKILYQIKQKIKRLIQVTKSSS